MRFGKTFALFFASSFIPGCSVVPNIKDVTGDRGYDIVRRVRCEMRDAIRSLVKVAIARRNKKLADSLVTDADFVRFDLKKLPKDRQEVIELYRNTQIGIDYFFYITETNEARVGFDVLNNLSRGMLGLNAGLGNFRERNTEQSFRSVDSFEKIVRTVTDEYCEKAGVRPANYMYPITGHLDLRRYAQEFLSLNQSGNLADDPGGANVSKSSVKLKFTTRNTAGITPDLDLPTRSQEWELTGIDGNLTATREDVHQITVVFILPKAGDQRDPTIAENRVEGELDYLRTQDDLRSFGRR